MLLDKVLICLGTVSNTTRYTENPTAGGIVCQLASSLPKRKLQIKQMQKGSNYDSLCPAERSSPIFTCNASHISGDCTYVRTNVIVERMNIRVHIYSGKNPPLLS